MSDFWDAKERNTELHSGASGSASGGSGSSSLSSALRKSSEGSLTGEIAFASGELFVYPDSLYSNLRGYDAESDFCNVEESNGRNSYLLKKDFNPTSIDDYPHKCVCDTSGIRSSAKA